LKREIKIFKSFEEQERYHLQLLSKSTATDRFKTLYIMQQWTKRFHPNSDNIRKIIIRKNGHS